METIEEFKKNQQIILDASLQKKAERRAKMLSRINKVEAYDYLLEDQKKLQKKIEFFIDCPRMRLFSQNLRESSEDQQKRVILNLLITLKMKHRIFFNKTIVTSSSAYNNYDHQGDLRRCVEEASQQYFDGKKDGVFNIQVSNNSTTRVYLLGSKTEREISQDDHSCFDFFHLSRVDYMSNFFLAISSQISSITGKSYFQVKNDISFPFQQNFILFYGTLRCRMGDYFYLEANVYLSWNYKIMIHFNHPVRGRNFWEKFQLDQEEIKKCFVFLKIKQQINEILNFAQNQQSQGQLIFPYEISYDLEELYQQRQLALNSEVEFNNEKVEKANVLHIQWLENVAFYDAKDHLKKIGQFYKDCRVFYVFPITRPKIEAQAGKCDLFIREEIADSKKNKYHKKNHDPKSPLFFKVGYSCNVSQRLEQHLNNYYLHGNGFKNIKFYPCNDQSIEEAFQHELDPQTGWTLKTSCFIQGADYNTIYDNIGYAQSAKVHDTELYRNSDYFTQCIEKFSKIVSREAGFPQYTYC